MRNDIRSSKPVGRPRRSTSAGPQESTFFQALEAAEVLLGERGYAGLSMEDVARKVGVTKATLYHHFPGGKDALIAAVGHRMLDRDRDGLERAVASSEQPRAQLENIAQWIFSSQRRTDTMLRDAQRFLPETLSHEITARFMTEFYARVHRVLEQGVRQGAFRAHDTAFSAWAFLGLLSSFADNASEFSPPNLARALVEFVCHGICPVDLS